MCARVQSDVLRVLRVLRGPVFQFCTCLWRHVVGVLRVLCVLLGLYVLYALCALYAFSKPYAQHRGPQKRASGQKRTDGSQRNMVATCACVHVCDARACACRCNLHVRNAHLLHPTPPTVQWPHLLLRPLSSRWCHPQQRLPNRPFSPFRMSFAKTRPRAATMAGRE